MWFLFPLPLGAWDGLRYFILALPEPSINYFTCLNIIASFFKSSENIQKKEDGPNCTVSNNKLASMTMN